MRNWLWDKKFAFMAWLKSPYMKRAAERFIDNDFVTAVVGLSIITAYVSVWMGLGALVHYLTDSVGLGILTAVFGALLSIFLIIFVNCYRKEKAYYLENGRRNY